MREHWVFWTKFGEDSGNEELVFAARLRAVGADRLCADGDDDEGPRVVALGRKQDGAAQSAKSSVRHLLDASMSVVV